MTGVRDIPVRDSTRLRQVTAAVADAVATAGLDERRAAAAALVATELATNLLKHAEGGRVLVETAPHPEAPRSGPGTVQILAVDHGPGIDDLPVARRDGYSTAGSLGAGLGTCQRLADRFDLHSRHGGGTVALARFGPGAPDGGPPPNAGGVHVPMDTYDQSGDAWTCATATRTTVMLADGLGHGPQAAHASGRAVRRLHADPDLPPERMLRELDTALRPTRGAAVAIAQVDHRSGTLRFAGVGNIGARLRTPGGWEHLLSTPGIVGAFHPARTRPVEWEWTARSVLVLHSDGLPSRWRYPDDAGLERHHPAAVAAVLLRDAVSAATPARDDTTIAVLSGAASGSEGEVRP